MMTQNTEIQILNNRKSVSKKSDTTLKLTNMNLIFSNGYSHYKNDIIEILQNFSSQGTLIGNANRNTVKYFSVKDIKINFKSFKQPNSFNRIVYKHFRKSKASRSFEYANLLIEKGFHIPQPIAYVEETNFSGLASSYYVSEHLEKVFTLREVIGNTFFGDREDILKGYTLLLYQLHENGIEFIDNSSANFLIKKMNGNYRFYIVDLNRMNFHRSMNISKRLANFSRLTNDLQVIKIISSEYALLAGISEKYCLKKIIDAAFRQQFKYKLKKKLKFYKSFNLNIKNINMKATMRKSINRILSILVGLIFIQSALRKIISSQEMLDKIEFIGPYADNLLILGCIEITAAILFMIPRTAILGTLLLVAYMGGAIATNLELAKSLWPSIIVSSFVWIAAFICNPELTHKILAKGRKSPAFRFKKYSLK